MDGLWFSWTDRGRGDSISGTATHLPPTVLALSRTIFRRGTATLFAVMIASLGAGSAAAAMIVVAIGIAFDVVRNVRAPDLQLRESEIAQALKESVAEPEQALAFHRSRFRKGSQLIFWGTILYTVIWMVVPSDGSIAKAYLGAFLPVHDAVGMVLGAIPRLAGDLAAHGYAARVPVVVHMHTVHFLTCIAWVLIFLMSGSWHLAHVLVAEERLRTRSRLWKLLCFVPLFINIIVLMYIDWSIWVDIDWDRRSGKRYNIHVSNFKFIFSFGMSMIISWLVCFSYSLVLVWSLGFSEIRRLPRQMDA